MMPGFTVPPEYQLVVSFLMAVMLAIGGVIAFVRNYRKASSPAAAPVTEQVRILGAMLGEAYDAPNVAVHIKRLADFTDFYRRFLEDDAALRRRTLDQIDEAVKTLRELRDEAERVRRGRHEG